MPTDSAALCFDVAGMLAVASLPVARGRRFVVTHSSTQTGDTPVVGSEKIGSVCRVKCDNLCGHSLANRRGSSRAAVA
eukprot:356902-Chlamydomonas_euryale.AAC.4